MAETTFGFTEPDITDLYTAVSRAFTGWKAEMLLRAIGIDPDDFPNFDRDAKQAWADVFKALRAGAIADPYRTLLRAALAQRPYHEVLLRLAGRHLRAVLVLGASPDTADHIRPDIELAGIRAAVGDRLAVDGLPAAQAADIDAVRERRPSVLHLACHTSGRTLLFERADGQEERVDPAALVRVLAAYRDSADAPLHGVVLNCCYGEGFAELFTSVADVVVAHRGDVLDSCAATFAAALYGAFAGRPDLVAAAKVGAAEAGLARQCADLADGLLVLGTRLP